MVPVAQSITPNFKNENARKKIGHDYHERVRMGTTHSTNTRNERIGHGNMTRRSAWC